MPQGRLRLISGFSINCAYELREDESGSGRLRLFPAMFTVLGDGDNAVLTLYDGEKRRVRLGQRLDLNNAAFRFIDEETRSLGEFTSEPGEGRGAR